MKKIYALGIAMLLASSLCAATPVLMVNGQQLDKAVTSLTFDGDNVIVHFAEETQQYDMESVEIKFETTAIESLKTYSLKATVADVLTVSGIKAGTPVEVYDIKGMLVSAATAEGETLTISLDACQPGVYVLRAGSDFVKFVKR